MSGLVSQPSDAASEGFRSQLPAGPPLNDADHLRDQAQLLQGQKAFEEAAHAWTQYLDRRPGDGAAANELGTVLASLGRHEESLVWFRRALMSQPGLAAAKRNLGAALRQLQRLEEALSCFQDMIASDPHDPAACFEVGVTLNALKRTGDALKWLQRAHDLRPIDAEAARELGDVLRTLKRNDEAIEAYRRSLALQPDSIPARTGLGSLLSERRSYDEAEKQFQAVVALEPTDLGGWLNLGAALLGCHRYAEALRAYRRALVIQPACAAAYCNMALALLSLERLDEATEACRKALILEPGSYVATFNLSCVQLAAGDFEQGWANYEARYRLESPDKKWARDDVKAAPWNGESLQGKSMLVIAEQGNGDLIQFARYAAALADLGCATTFQVSKRLHRLFGTLPGNVAFVDQVPPDARFDFQCSLMTFPARFKRLGIPIPTARYLAAEPERTTAWKSRIGDHGFRIGIIWQGNRYAGGDGFRSYPLSALRPLAAVPGVRMISLQLKPPKEELAALPAGMHIEELGPDFDAGEDAFVDSAAVMETADLIVTCDTSMAHLAGALHRPVWIALNESAEWRWLRNRSDSIWYPTARLFRQQTRGDWDGVFSQMARELAPLVERKAASLNSNVVDPALPAPRVDVSWGELIDKITILEIKSERLSNPAAIDNVRRELGLLATVASNPAVLAADIQQHRSALRNINEKLWDVEDAIRDCEARQAFDENFTRLARSVYMLNDERGRIKHAINAALKSLLVEEKQYRSYTPPES
jgi:tetratricopeptide (TPR) repeat protein